MEKAEFDHLAGEYHDLHQQNITASGEAPEYFSEYKIADVAEIVKKYRIDAQNVLDYGSGVGNSIPWFRRYLPTSDLTCSDVSARSIELARQRFPGDETYVEITEKALPLESNRFDLVFTACVFHHIPHDEHVQWLLELLRVTKPGGVFVLFEHNPWNPLTVRAVNTCPLDANARLISAPRMRETLAKAGWSTIDTWYRIFFPKALRALRPLEPHMRGIPLGAQYCLIGQKRNE